MASLAQLRGLGCVMLLVAVSCAPPPATDAVAEGKVSLMDSIRAAIDVAPDPGVQSQLPARTGNLAAVEDFPEHPPFATIARSELIEAYPCSQCHNQPLAQMLATRKADSPNSHWQIELRHASEAVMNCQTCHGTGDMDAMQTTTGKRVSFDIPHQVCAQCHATQVKDWAGGAHGKRLGGWAPPRVVENCTGCHNPHAPAFESRWPAHLGKGGSSYTGR